MLPAHSVKCQLGRLWGWSRDERIRPRTCLPQRFHGQLCSPVSVVCSAALVSKAGGKRFHLMLYPLSLRLCMVFEGLVQMPQRYGMRLMHLVNHGLCYSCRHEWRARRSFWSGWAIV